TQPSGPRVERYTLDDGDVITIGGNELYFLVDIPEASQSASDTGGPAELAAPPSPIQLVFVAGPNEGASIPLADTQITFGRRQDATVTLDDMQVSGLHCGVTQVAGPSGPEVHITDLGSTNGTFLN